MKTIALLRACGSIMAGVLLLAGCAPSPAPQATPAPAVAATLAAAPTPVSVLPTPVPTRAPAPPQPAGKQPKYGGVLTVRNPDPPTTFDMHQATRIDVSVPFSNVY
ncbi:MAG: hypothetical protein AAB502_09070, partial [Chloroflexota bacterium]